MSRASPLLYGHPHLGAAFAATRSASRLGWRFSRSPGGSLSVSARSSAREHTVYVGKVCTQRASQPEDRPSPSRTQPKTIIALAEGSQTFWGRPFSGATRGQRQAQESAQEPCGAAGCRVSGLPLKAAGRLCGTQSRDAPRPLPDGETPLRMRLGA